MRFPPFQSGPLSVHLTAGEFQVIKSIAEYSIPRVVGWCAAMDNAVDRSIDMGSQGRRYSTLQPPQAIVQPPESTHPNVSVNGIPL